MTDEELLALLHSLGVNKESFPALILLPLVQVAWADGRIQDKERALILKIAKERDFLKGTGDRLLEEWLRFPPSDRYLARGRLVLAELAKGEHLALGGVPKADELLDLCEKVVRVGGGIFDRIGNVSEVERAAVAEIANELRKAQASGAPVASSEPSADETVDMDTDDDSEITGTVGVPAEPREWRPQASAPVVRRGEGPPAVALIVHPEEEGEFSVDITTHLFALGRRPDNQIVVFWDSQVSRVHCRFHAYNDQWFVVDCGSVNGTWVDGERVLERRLRGGEIVSIGRTRLKFQLFQ